MFAKAVWLTWHWLLPHFVQWCICRHSVDVIPLIHCRHCKPFNLTHLWMVLRRQQGQKRKNWYHNHHKHFKVRALMKETYKHILPQVSLKAVWEGMCIEEVEYSCQTTSRTANKSSTIRPCGTVEDWIVLSDGSSNCGVAWCRDSKLRVRWCHCIVVGRLLGCAVTCAYVPFGPSSEMYSKSVRVIKVMVARLTAVTHTVHLF